MLMNEMHESTARPRSEPEAKLGMVINCAAYQGGCRVADIDLDRAREVDTSDGRFVWIGLHEPDQELLHTVQQRSDEQMTAHRSSLPRQADVYSARWDQLYDRRVYGLCRSLLDCRVGSTQEQRQPAREQLQFEFAKFSQDGTDPLMHLGLSA